MYAIHQRLAELWLLQKKRKFTDEELDEFHHCLEANANMAWKLAKLYNLSLLASMTGDTNWLHCICMKIEELEKTNKIDFN